MTNPVKIVMTDQAIPVTRQRTARRPRCCASAAMGRGARMVARNASVRAPAIAARDRPRARLISGVRTVKAKDWNESTMARSPKATIG